MTEKSRGIGWLIMDGLGDVAEDGIINGLAAIAATFIVRKVLILAWTKATGKEPPVRPEDPGVALAEALGWSMLTGVTIGTARVLAIRTARLKTHRAVQGRELAEATGDG